jgi:hypothetical protein
VSSFAQTSKIHRAGPDKIDNEYIVVLQDDILPQQVPDVARQVAAAHGADLKKVWSSAINGFFAIMPEARAEAMTHNPHGGGAVDASRRRVVPGAVQLRLDLHQYEHDGSRRGQRSAGGSSGGASLDDHEHEVHWTLRVGHDAFQVDSACSASHQAAVKEKL